MRGVLELSNCFPPNVGGVETHLYDLVHELARRDWQVHVVSYYPLTTRVAWQRHEEWNGVHITRLGWFGQGWFHVLEKYPLLQFLYLVPRLLWGASWWLVRHGRQVQVIHAHGLAAAFCARLLGPLFHKRTVFSSHAVYPLDPASRLARAIGWILSGLHKTITLSAQSREQLIRTGVPPDKVDRFLYWIDLDVFTAADRQKDRQSLDLSPDQFVFLFVGRLIAIKGVRLLLEAARNPDLKRGLFFFAGTGPLEAEIRAAAGDLPNIRFLGSVANRDLPKYYRSADVLCVPSQYEEGFGRVICEALACGTPIVGADCAGIREATSPEVAWLIHPEAQALTDILRRLLQHPEEASARRRTCRSLAEERYAARNVAMIEKALLG